MRSPQLLRAFLFLLAATPILGVAPGQAAERYSPQQLRADIDALQAGIAATHPHPSHSVDPAQLQLAIDALRQRASTGLDRDAAWRDFSTLNPLLADGHFFVGYADWRAETEQHLRDGGALFPFEITVDAQARVRILSELGGAATALSGSSVETINGVPAGDVARALLAHVHGDSARFRADLLSRRWWFFYWKVYGAPASFELTLAGPAQARLRRPASRAHPSILVGEDDFDRQFAFELRPGAAAVMTIRTFSWPEQAPFEEFTRRAFQQMQASGTRTLIIDVRQNGGGNDAMWLQGLLPYIADRPYRWASRYTKKVLRDDPAKHERQGQVLSGTVDTWSAPRTDDPLHFDGKVYVLIGRGTYSSAVLFADTMQDFGFGTLLGEGASVRSTQTGGVQKIALPQTGLVLWAPRLLLVRPSDAATPLWLTPDIGIDDDPLHPDAMVDAALAIAAAKR
ncbi:Peptidase family S41 [Xanthomonas sp. SS]|uniref:S41 family peptidase n=1 Tax=Xanthomonas sp. SS TaxID=2724122 RepID=UPI00163989E9|nr:S41 family peptidase [Xanthomonas sp. SS]QNH17945.1 Peptidase family S41 [Xanthomonas sp. SS]